MTPVEVSDFAELIGKRLKQLRQSRSFTQADVAECSGLSRPAIGRIESGHVLPSLESIARYARACGYDVIDVMLCLAPPETAMDHYLQRLNDLRELVIATAVAP